MFVKHLLRRTHIERCDIIEERMNANHKNMLKGISLPFISSTPIATALNNVFTWMCVSRFQIMMMTMMMMMLVVVPYMNEKNGHFYWIYFYGTISLLQIGCYEMEWEFYAFVPHQRQLFMCHFYCFIAIWVIHCCHSTSSCYPAPTFLFLYHSQ
jgi:hypothetical protein